MYCFFAHGRIYSYELNEQLLISIYYMLFVCIFKLILILLPKIYKKQLEEHRAKVNASIRKEYSKKLKTTKQDGHISPEKSEKSPPELGRLSSREYQIAPQKYSVGNLEPLDMGAHLQLLGESLMLVATALRRQVGILSLNYIISFVLCMSGFDFLM